MSTRVVRITNRKRCALGRGTGASPRPGHLRRTRRLSVVALLTCAVTVNVGACREFNIEDGSQHETTTAGSSSHEAPTGGHSGDPGGGSVGESGRNVDDGSGGVHKPTGGEGLTDDFGGNGAGGELNGAGGELNGAGSELNGAGSELNGAGGEANGAGGELNGAGGEAHEREVIPPSHLKNLSLWLDASTASGSGQVRVSTWRDQSGNENHAQAVQDSVGPSWVSEALNGLPVVRFDGHPSSLQIADAASLQFGRMPFTIAFVGSWQNVVTPTFTYDSHGVATLTYVGYGGILIKVAPSAPYAGLAIFANAPSPFPTAPAQSRLAVQLEFSTAFLTSAAFNLNDGKHRLHVIQRTAPGAVEIRINGSAHRREIPESIDVSAAGSPLMLGGEAARAFTGCIAELVMVKGALSSIELRGLEAYFVQKFGL